jgi:hypothetical protein
VALDQVVAAAAAAAAAAVAAAAAAAARAGAAFAGGAMYVPFLRKLAAGLLQPVVLPSASSAGISGDDSISNGAVDHGPAG